MKKTLPALMLFCALASPLWADLPEMPNFSLMFHGGVSDPNGFIQGNPGPEIGGWMGIGISDRFDGFFAIDYYAMPNVPITINGQPNDLIHNPSAGTTVVQPTDDISFSINTRWYPFNDKWDYPHHRYNLSPYLLTGLGLDLVVDGIPYTSPSVPPPEFGIVSNGYDILFSTNIGAGIDFPTGNGREVSIYTEALDHLIFWQNLTQVFDFRVGIRFMLDTAHVDPFR